MQVAPPSVPASGVQKGARNPWRDEHNLICRGVVKIVVRDRCPLVFQQCCFMTSSTENQPETRKEARAVKRTENTDGKHTLASVTAVGNSDLSTSTNYNRVVPLMKVAFLYITVVAICWKTYIKIPRNIASPPLCCKSNLLEAKFSTDSNEQDQIH